MQPYRGDERLIVEARNNDGTLKFNCKQPPTEFLDCNLDDLYKAMWREWPNAEGTWDMLREWLQSKSWTVRQRTW